MNMLPEQQVIEIEVGTPEWDAHTQRRAILIDKKYSPSQGLTDVEEAEYERLQELSRAALDRAFPRPRLSGDELAAVKQALGMNDVGGGQ